MGVLCLFIDESYERMHLLEEEKDDAKKALVGAVYGYLACIVASAGLYMYGHTKAKQEQTDFQRASHLGSLNS